MSMGTPASTTIITNRPTSISAVLSTHADGEQHLTLGQRFHGMRHVRFQHQSLAVAKPMATGRGLDSQVAPKAMDHDMTRSPMLRQASAGLEREQQEAKGTAMYQACLPVAGLRGV
jgi:hypothetical protein